MDDGVIIKRAHMIGSPYNLWFDEYKATEDNLKDIPGNKGCLDKCSKGKEI